MTCRDYRKAIEALEQLSQISSEMEVHTHSCDECRRILDERRKLDALLKTLPSPELSSADWEDIEQNIMRSIPSGEKAHNSKVISFPRENHYRMMFATAAALLVMLTLLWKNKPSQQAQAFASIISVSYVQGSVAFTDKDTGRGEHVRVLSDFPDHHMPAIGVGTTIETPDSAGLGFRINDMAEAAVGNRSRMDIVKSDRDGTTLRLSEGELTIHVDPAKRRGHFTVLTKNTLCIITGTLFQLSVKDSAGFPLTRLYVEKGCVKFARLDIPHDTLNVVAGQTAMAMNSRTTEVTSIFHPALNRLMNPFAAGEATPDSIGFLHIITTPPACSLYASGKSLGISPLFIAFKTGPWTITISRHGYETNQEPVIIRSGVSSRVYCILNKAPVPEGTDTLSGLVTQQPEKAVQTDSIKSKIKATPIDTMSELYRTARKLITAGKFKEALPVLRQCAPGNAVCRMWLSRCLEELGRFDEALNVISGLVSDPSVPGVMRDNAKYGLIELYMNGKKDARMALASVEGYLNEFPDGSWVEEALYEKGRLLQLFNRHAEAAAILESYRNHFPSGPRLEKTLYEAGILRLHRLNDPASALRDFEQLLKTGSRTYTEDALYWKAQSLFLLGKSVDALDVYNQYLVKYPSGRYLQDCEKRVKSLYTGK